MAVVAVSGLLLLYWGLRRLGQAERQRLAKAKLMDVVDAVPSEPIDEDSESITRSSAYRSIENRFDFIRRIFAPGVFTITGLLVLIPLLPALPATYVTLIVGSLTVIIGIAGKPIIENAIAGIVITLSQPIRINDTVVIDEKYGTIEKITLLYTVLKVWNSRRYIIPNHKLLQKEFENLTVIEDQEWAHVDFSVAPGSDINFVKQLAKEAMKCKYLSDQEPPSFWVMELRTDSILCWVAGWARNPGESWALKSTTRRQLLEQFTKHNIDFQLSRSHVNFTSGDRPPVARL